MTSLSLIKYRLQKLSYKLLLSFTFLLAGSLLNNCLSQNNYQSALNHIESFNEWIENSPDTASIYLNKAEQIAETIDNDSLDAIIFTAKSKQFAMDANYKESVKVLFKALTIYSELEDNNKIASTYQNIGNAYIKIGLLDKAYENCAEALNHYEQSNNLQGCYNVYNTIGSIFRTKKDAEKTIFYYKKCKEIAKKINSDYNLAVILNNIGLYYQELQNPDSALSYLLMALPYSKKMGKSWEAASHLNIGISYLDAKKYTIAQKHFESTLVISNELAYPNGQAYAHLQLGELALNQNQIKKGVDHLAKCVEISKLAGLLTREAAASQLLINAHETLKDYESGFKTAVRLIELKDSIFNEKSTATIEGLEAQYQNEKKQLEITSLKNEKALQQETILRQEIEDKQKNTLLIASVVALSLLILLAGFIYKNFKIKQRDNLIISKQKKEVETQKMLVEEKNTEITDSIQYAQRIQKAILPPLSLVQQNIPNSFIFYRPKDVVSGDFYWMEAISAKNTPSVSTKYTSQERTTFFAVADCTGHGVPGAMVSVVCVNSLNRSVREFGCTNPAEILNKTKTLVIETFEQSDEEVKDGMDISLVKMNTETRELEWAGAHNPLYIFRKGSLKPETLNTNQPQLVKTTEFDNHTLFELVPSKQPIGAFSKNEGFTNHKVQLQKGDSLYLFSDGYADQFGGKKGKKFMSKRFKKLLESLQTTTMQKQEIELKTAIENWMIEGDTEQIDDICIAGIRV